MAHDDWITTAEAARLSGYTLQRVRQLIAAGEVKGQRFGQVWQVSRRSLLAYAKRAAKLGAKRGPKTGG
jgi:excisionase family DNA binding protein